MYDPHIVSKMCNLTKKHGIPEALLNLELTESAYMDNPETMREVVNEFQQHGFKVMMDDFGSGYSSLNTLKDIHVDYLKIDMKFLLGKEESGRSERILASIIRMAGWLDLPVIVEGVETKDQADFLRSIGCGFVQGYFFARPMPVDKYEEIVRSKSAEPEDESSQDGKIKESIWSYDDNTERMFNSIHKPIGIFEYDGTRADVLRVNNSYNRCFGYGVNVLAHAAGGQSGEQISRMLNTVMEQKSGTAGRVSVPDAAGKGHSCAVYMDRIGSVGNRAIVLVLFLDCLDRENCPEQNKELCAAEDR